MPSVTLINFPESPFELISGSSPLFTKLVTDFAGDEAASDLQAVAPYLAIIKNNSTASVRSFTVICNTVSPNGKAERRTVTFEVKPGVSPGEMVLTAPASGLMLYMSAEPGNQGAGHSGPALRNVSHLNERMANFLRDFTEETKLSLSLDSVIFRDHTFVGPDHAGKFDEENRERQITREIVTELLNRAPSERSAYLNTIIDNPQSSGSLAVSEFDERQRIASRFQGRADRGDEGLFRRSMENILNDEVRPLRRRTKGS